MAQANKSEKSTASTRREFLKTSTAATAAAMTGALGLQRGVFAAGSNIIKVGMIGCGGRNTGAAVQALTADKGARLYAMCDIFMDRVMAKRDILKNKKKDQVVVSDEFCLLRRIGSHPDRGDTVGQTPV